VSGIGDDGVDLDLEAWGSCTFFKFSRIASAFLPVCGTGGMFKSVPETLNCFSFSTFGC
jgi:hypothetical protein